MNNRILESILLTLCILASAAPVRCHAEPDNKSLIVGAWHRIINPEEKYIKSAMVVFSEDGTLWGSSEYEGIDLAMTLEGIDLAMTLEGTYKFLADNVLQIHYELTKQYGSGKTVKEQVTLLWQITGLTEKEMTVEFLPERKQKYAFRK